MRYLLEDNPLVNDLYNQEQLLSVAREYKKRGIRLEPEIELASYELLISLARIGLGVAGITEEFSAEALQQGVVRKLSVSTPLPERAVSMLSLRNTEPSMAAQKFMELIKLGE